MTDARLARLDAALAAVGDRWTLLVVASLLDGPRRFNDLLAALPGLAPNVLTNRIRRLEAEGLVVATPYSHRPLRVAYALGARGEELAGACALLAAWGGHERVPRPDLDPDAETLDPRRLWTTDRLAAGADLAGDLDVALGEDLADDLAVDLADALDDVSFV